MTTFDLDAAVHDELILRTLPGVVDYLFEDLRQLDGATVTVIRRYRNGIRITYDGPLRPLAAVRYFDVCSLPLSGDPSGESVDDAELQRLAHSQTNGVLSAFTAAAAKDVDVLRFRVADIGADRWNFRNRVETSLEWTNSPSDWDLNIDRFDGQLVAEIGPLHLTQRFGELDRMPASTNPVIAAVMVRLAKLEPGDVVLDPFCGAGTILTLAGESAPVTLIGCDLNPSWLELAERNLTRRGLKGQLMEGDSQKISLGDGSVDRVISNIPFGKRIGSHESNTGLYPAVLREIARLMHSRSRAVLLTDDKRLFKESVQRTPLIRVVKEIMLEQHGGLHPTAYVISKRGNSPRTRSPER